MGIALMLIAQTASDGALDKQTEALVSAINIGDIAAIITSALAIIVAIVAIIMKVRKSPEVK